MKLEIRKEYAPIVGRIVYRVYKDEWFVEYFNTIEEAHRLVENFEASVNPVSETVYEKEV
jgi:hypothetical protein